MIAAESSTPAVIRDGLRAERDVQSMVCRRHYARVLRGSQAVQGARSLPATDFLSQSKRPGEYRSSSLMCGPLPWNTRGTRSLCQFRTRIVRMVPAMSRAHAGVALDLASQARRERAERLADDVAYAENPATEKLYSRIAQLLVVCAIYRIGVNGAPWEVCQHDRLEVFLRRLSHSTATSGNRRGRTREDAWLPRSSCARASATRF